MDDQQSKGKKKSREFRRRASPGQVEALEKVYVEKNTPDPLQMIELAETLDLAVDWLYNWFYRRKRKDGRLANQRRRNRGKKNSTVKSHKAEASSPVAAAEGSCAKKRKAKAKKNAAPATKPRNSPVQGAMAQSTGSASPSALEMAPAPSNRHSHQPVHPNLAPETNAAPASPWFSPASEGHRASVDIASAPHPSFPAMAPPAIPASFFTGEMPLETIFGQGPPHLSSDAAFFPSENPMAGMDMSPIHYLGHESTLQGLVDGWLEGYRPVEGIL
ncbi:hypothetical protein NLJ89_g9763 [Agrocybe chaxingu]|uniref:Homeobox domain-containing protein n=1 Tax=Agrocybe chaxingu TaxID=84603 RepID=A0A9W8JSF0_9AGAR|nr:hypothetical protein NLJ89_g9763 [Agrocybe chaxingu]